MNSKERGFKTPLSAMTCNLRRATPNAHKQINTQATVSEKLKSVLLGQTAATAVA
jgi:hypothetical protein